jgi:GntR family transcriptional repressor for pyruvate dehydrogenase complex
VDAIRGGLYEPGDLLPPERELAERLVVSRKVLREAIEVLRSAGIVSVRRGAAGGTVVESLEHLGGVSAGIQGQTRESLRSLLEVRRTLELTAAVLASQRLTGDDKRHLRRLVDMLEPLDENPRAFWEADIRFHFTVADMSGNSLLSEFLSQTFARLAVIREQFPYAYVPHDAAIRNQEDTLAALCSGDGSRVIEAVDEHLASLEYVLIGRRLRLDGTPGAPADATAAHGFLEARDRPRLQRERSVDPQ